MGLTFIEIVIVLFFIVILPFCKLLHDSFSFNNKNNILYRILMEANYYAYNSIGLEPKTFSTISEEKQNNFIGYGIGYLRQNYNEILNQYNINNNDILCSLLISKLNKLKQDHKNR